MSTKLYIRMSEIALTDANFDAEVLQSEQPVLVDFWAPWCGPCIIMGPVIDELAKEADGKAKVAKLNVDENQEKAGQYGVSSIPTIIIFRDGKESERLVGVQQKDALKAKLGIS